MSSQYSIYSFRAEIQETGSPTEVTVSLTRSPAVAKKPRVRRVVENFAVTQSQKSLKVIRLYSVECGILSCIVVRYSTSNNDGS